MNIISKLLLSLGVVLGIVFLPYITGTLEERIDGITIFVDIHNQFDRIASRWIGGLLTDCAIAGMGAILFTCGVGIKQWVKWLFAEKKDNGPKAGDSEYI